MPTRFVHLTDLHINHPGLADPTLLTDTTATLARVTAAIRLLDPAPDFVIVSGDLTNKGDPASFGAVRAALADIGLPMFLALGNHDTRPGFYQGYLGRDGDLDAPYVHAGMVAGTHVIVLDSHVRGRIGGALDARQFAFLGAELVKHPDAPKLIVVHHPPDVGSAPAADGWHCLARADSDRLGAMLQGHRVSGVLSGHVHYDSVAMWCGIPCITGAGLHAGTDKVREDALRIVRGASFGIGTIDDGRLSMVFVPLPGDRAELRVIAWETLRNWNAAAVKAPA